MKTVRLTDCTLRLPAEGHNALGFREKVEIIKELDRLCIDAIELNILSQRRAEKEGASCYEHQPTSKSLHLG